MKLKDILSPILGIILSGLYITATVGFDVHTDHHSGQVFVVSMLEKTDCESLHPGDHCHCFEHHSGECHEHDEDCENEVDVLTIAGDGYFFGVNFFVAAASSLILAEPCASSITATGRAEKNIFRGPPRSILTKDCVLRV